MLRKKIIAGNWKMHKTFADADTLVGEIAAALQKTLPQAEVWIAPPALYLPTLIQQFGHSGLQFGAQDISEHLQGAFTGEIAAGMVKSTGATFTLVGHSERRQYHGETDQLINHKIQSALAQGLTAIYCCGETLEERNTGNHFTVVANQLSLALFGFTAETLKDIVIAYEPVWAIGTGVTASSAQAQEMHAFIRTTLAEKYGETTANTVRILYGGSVKPANAAELFAQPDIDGGLIGGASLVAADFMAIIEGAA